MPGRLTPLRTNETYHVYNRGIEHRPTFITKKEYERALLTLRYYQNASLPVRLSIFLSLSSDARQQMLKTCESKQNTRVRILAFCLMPNHFHILLRQTQDRGISTFLSDFQNSYTRYFNVKNKRDGSLFLGQFKAAHIETDHQLMHVSRYMHLNPYTSSVCHKDQLLSYPWSSFQFYHNGIDNWIDTSTILSLFRSKDAYMRFVLDQADYQKTLHRISHLTFEGKSTYEN